MQFLLRYWYCVLVAVALAVAGMLYALRGRGRADSARRAREEQDGLLEEGLREARVKAQQEASKAREEHEAAVRSLEQRLEEQAQKLEEGPQALTDFLKAQGKKIRGEP